MTDPVAWLAQAAPAPGGIADYGSAVGRNIIIFCLTMACLYALAWYVIRRLRAGSTARDAGGIDVVASTLLEPGKRVHLVRFRGREWLIAATASQCSVIAEVTSPSAQPEPFTIPKAAADATPPSAPSRGTPT